MKKSLALIILFLLFGASLNAQIAPVSPLSGALTGQPGIFSPMIQVISPAPAAPSNPTAQTVMWITSGFRRFNDPMLDSLIQLGLDTSPNIKSAISRLEEARIRVNIAQSFLAPSLRSSLLITTQSLSERRRVPITTADQLPRFQLNTFQLLPVDASYELDLFKRIRHTIALTDLQAQAGEADLQSFRLTLASDIARTYLLIRGNDTEQAVFRRNSQSRDTTLSILRERFRVGLISQIDVQRAETDFATLQVSLKGLERARLELVNALAQLCAQDPARFAVPAGRLPVHVPAYPYAAVGVEQLQRRPDLMQLARQNQVATTQVAVQQATILPRVSLVASGGLLSGQVGPWFTPSSATYLVGVNASVPLYEGHRAKHTIALAKQVAQSNQQTYQQALQLAQRDAETALDNLSLLGQQIELQHQTLGLARRTEIYNRELYVRGLATYLEVLDAQRTILAGEQQLVQLRSQETQYAVALFRAVGGDW